MSYLHFKNFIDLFDLINFIVQLFAIRSYCKDQKHYFLYLYFDFHQLNYCRSFQVPRQFCYFDYYLMNFVIIAIIIVLSFNTNYLKTILIDYLLSYLFHFIIHLPLMDEYLNHYCSVNHFDLS